MTDLSIQKPLGHPVIVLQTQDQLSHFSQMTVHCKLVTLDDMKEGMQGAWVAVLSYIKHPGSWVHTEYAIGGQIRGSLTSQ